MEKIYINIDEKIDNHRCPGAYFCVQATTHYEKHEAERMCLRCWKDYCRENGYGIDYGNGVVSD